MEERQGIGLAELQRRIRESLSESFPEQFWVKAEISEVKQNASGHCYLTLVEKNAGSSAPIAKASAIIWASSFRLIRTFFEHQTGSALSVGMSILVRAQVQYSELYGLSLIISDIDPSFTVGELELQRQRTIARLREEGMFDMNGSLELPLLPRRLALITSPTAAGYRDFMMHLTGNEFGFLFRATLFEAVMQGQEAPGSIIAALDRVAAESGNFDAVLIMRGGGGAMDLVCYDDYELAVNVAQFPLPVLVGVGHDHDYHIVDMVAHTSVKTPTALADFLIDLFADEDFRVDSLSQRMHLALKGKFAAQEAMLDKLKMKMASAVSLKSVEERHKLDSLELRIAAADPSEVLKKGWALLLKDGRRISSVKEVSEGDSLTVMLHDGLLNVKL